MATRCATGSASASHERRLARASLKQAFQHSKLPTMSASRPHRKLVKHYHEPGDLHALTFSCYKRQPLLTNDAWRQQLARCVESAGEELEMRLAAFVFMPEHVHLLVVPMSSEPAFDEYLARVKQPFSKWVRQQLTDVKSPLLNRLTVEERPGKTCFRFWQEGPGYDRNLATPAVIEAAVQYIHMNPVRRGLVERAVDWKWSSARWYLLDPARQQLPGLPFIHGLPAGTLDRA
jgi:putative transposase